MAEIAERAVEDLVPYARNPRKNDAVVDQMAASIREFGFKVPILALSDGTVADHLRLKAAQKLKIEAVPVILCDEWTPAQVKAFRLMAKGAGLHRAVRLRNPLPDHLGQAEIRNKPRPLPLAA